MMNCPKFFDKAIEYSFYLLFFLTPLLVSPVNYELFEFPKMLFVYFLTTIIVTGWLGKIIVSNEIKIKRTILDIPLLIYFSSSLLSTVFSLDPYTSVWGYYTRSHGGLLSISCYILLYYAFASNLNKKQVQKTLTALLLSALLAGIYGILERLGIDKNHWVQDVQNRVFSTLGQPNWLGALMTSIVFIPLSKFLNKEKSKTAPWLLLFAYAIYFLCLIFTNSKSAILAFWLSAFIFTLFCFWKNKKTARLTLPLFVFSLIIYLFLGGKTYSYLKKTGLWLNIFSSQPLASPPPISTLEGEYKPFISESSEIRKIVWQGSLEIWRHYPLFGSGLETFGYSYYNFRPAEHNLLSEWDFLYNKAHNEFLNILSCQGALGIISYLLIIGVFVFWVFKNFKKTDGYLLPGLMSGYIGLLITNFFGFSVVMTGLLFFFIPAFSFILSPPFFKNKEEEEFFCFKFYFKLKTKALKFLEKASLVLLAGFCFYVIYSLFLRWQADYFFSRGEKHYQQDYLLTAFYDLQKAVSLNPHEALYHAYLAKDAAKMAVVYSETEATESAEIIDQLVGLAELEINTALLLNPVHLNFYKNRAEVFIYLSHFDNEYNQKAIQALSQAIELAPTDAKILYNLGILYEQEDENEKAIQTLEKAVSLKPNYLHAFLKLAKVYLKTGEKEKAEQTLKFILENIDPVNQEAKELWENMNITPW